MSTVQHPPAGAVLTGGSSTRMGTDKALLPVDGTAMAVRVADALTAAGCSPVVLVGGDRRRIGRLGPTFVADVHPGDGPVGGIITAMRALAESADAVVITSCDLPLLTADHLRPLIDTFLAGDSAVGAPGRAGFDVVVARSDRTSRIQPLCAVWRSSALDRIETAFVGGTRSVFGVLDLLDVVEIEVAGDGLWNVNSPSDLDAVTSYQYPASVAYGEITVDELMALGDAVRVIDVREPDEWAESHIPWAVHVPLGTIADNLAQFDGAPTYVVCRSGGRSGRACDYAADQGLDTVNVVGGMLAWWDAGFATERGADG